MDSLTRQGCLEISVVVPARNAGAMIESCLASIRRNQPKEIIVVDGESTDETVQTAEKFAAVVISDRGTGVSQARQMGAEAAASPYVAFIDVDVELPDNALTLLVAEMQERGLAAIQADLASQGAGDYWSRALAEQHMRGKSRGWFGLSATVFRRETVLAHPFDPAFRSGEDIEIRWRFRRAGINAAVSHAVVARHKFGRGFAFARGQWVADGAGLGRMVRKYGPAAWPLLGMPLAGALFGVGRSLVRTPQDIPYYLLYLGFNYAGMTLGLLDSRVRRFRRGCPR